MNLAYYILMPYKDPEKKRAWQRRHNGRHRESYLWRRYGLTIDAFNNLLSGQGGKCGCCGEEITEKKGPIVHHDHKTGDIVGILCNNCNCAAGHLDDNPIKAHMLANYLDKHTVL